MIHPYLGGRGRKYLPNALSSGEFRWLVIADVHPPHLKVLGIHRRQLPGPRFAESCVSSLGGYSACALRIALLVLACSG